MPLPRFRIRALMIAVAGLAILMVVVPPWWHYWFQSPWRLITAKKFTSPDGRLQATEISMFFDTRKPADRSRFHKAFSELRSCAGKVKVERFATFPRDRFPTFTDAEIRGM